MSNECVICKEETSNLFTCSEKCSKELSCTIAIIGILVKVLEKADCRRRKWEAENENQ